MAYEFCAFAWDTIDCEWPWTTIYRNSFAKGKFTGEMKLEL